MGTLQDDFFIHGWAVFHENDLHLMQEDAFVGYLKGKYLNIWPSADLVEFSERLTIDQSDRICEWHNDAKWGMNITFLYYASTMHPETGGSISLRNLDLDLSVKIYPEAGTLIMMSQKSNVEHKAEMCKIQRHMFNIDFDVEGF